MVNPELKNSGDVLWRGPAAVKQGSIAAWFDTLGTPFIWSLNGLMWVVILFFYYQIYGLVGASGLFGAGLCGYILVHVCRRIFPPSSPAPPSTLVPLKLTRHALSVSEMDEDIPVEQILDLSRDYHMGSPSLELTLSQKTITLISAERDSLYNALLPLIRTHEATP